MFRLEHIRKIYPTGEVLQDVNWEVKTGDHKWQNQNVRSDWSNSPF